MFIFFPLENSNARIDHALSVRVKDVNDEVPLLQHPLSGVISENSPAMSLIMTVKAVDKDVTAAFRQVTPSPELPGQVTWHFENTSPTTEDD